MMNTLKKVRLSLRWLPAYGWQRLTRRPPRVRPLHLIFALADHFEPSIQPETLGQFAPRSEQVRRLERWCELYPKMAGQWRDEDGRPFVHTYFFPADQYDSELVGMLAQHCSDGWGEVEVHLHHGLDAPDSSEGTRRKLVRFRDALADHGCLSQLDGKGQARYAFVHGNWALANSARGNFCGVDDELQVLSETGCFADFTLPSAPDQSQVAKINALYEPSQPLDRRAPHRRGRTLRVGRYPQIYPLIIEGPLLPTFSRQRGGHIAPKIENSAVTTANPPTLERLRLWRRANINVSGRPDWLFIKLHCHGMDPRDEAAMLGDMMTQFLQELVELSQRTKEFRIHFTTAREMVNIALAACDGREGSPGDYRDYRFRRITSSKH